LAVVESAGALGWLTAVDLDGAPAEWRTLDALNALCDAFDYLFINRHAAADIWQDASAGGAISDTLTHLESASRKAHFASSRARTLILTLGEQGALVVPRDRAALFVEPLPVRSIDTTGAGDVFAGVFLTLTLHGEEAATAARAASAAAALSTLGEGAQGALPTATDVLRAGLPPAHALSL
jgi:ribokinase